MKPRSKASKEEKNYKNLLLDIKRARWAEKDEAKLDAAREKRITKMLKEIGKVDMLKEIQGEWRIQKKDSVVSQPL